MSAAVPPSTAPQAGPDQPWPAVAERVAAYLEAAGLKGPAAGDFARGIAARCAEAQPGLAEESALLAGLRAARRLLTEQGVEGEAESLLAPRDQPLSIRRRAF